jgi:hypothetical protein
MIGDVFMLYQSMREFLEYRMCEELHKSRIVHHNTIEYRLQPLLLNSIYIMHLGKGLGFRDA